MMFFLPAHGDRDLRLTAPLVSGAVLALTCISPAQLWAQEPITEGVRADQMADVRLVDLAASQLFPVPGETIDVSVSVENRADDPLATLHVVLYADAAPIGRQSIELQAQTRDSVRFSWTTPDQPSVVRLTAIADPGGDLTENDRLDNALSIQIGVAPPPPTGVDYGLSDLEFVTDPEGPSQVRFEVVNSGSSRGVVAVEVSDDRGGREILLLRLGPGEQRSLSLPWSSLAQRFEAQIGPRYAATESDATNNRAQLDRRPTLDLRLENLSVAATDQRGRRFRSVSISFRLLNVGRDAVNRSFRTAVVLGSLSDDDVQPTIDTAYVTTETLGAGESAFVTHTVPLPRDSFHVRIVTDVDGAVDESDEGNNVSSASYRNPVPDINRWASIGPRRLTSGLGATGRLMTMAIDPRDPSVIYTGSQGAGSGGSGLWKTVDGGLTWRPVSDALPTLSITDVALHPSQPNRVYVATRGFGVFVSNDGGTSWMQ